MLRTTTDNKRRHYLKRKVAKRHYLLADALHANFCEVLQEFPELAERLGMDDRPEPTVESELVAQIQSLSPDQKAKLVQDLMSSLLGSDRSAG